MKRPLTSYRNKIYIVSKPQEQYKNNILAESLPNSQYNKFLDNYEEELGELQNSWNTFGVTNEFRIAFLNQANKVKDSDRKNIFIQEKNNLKKFRESLLNLKKEISEREQNILKLKKLNSDLEICISKGNNIDSRKNILQEIISVIKNLRLNAINIVERFIIVNQISAYYSSSGKWNIKKLSPEYSYNKNYPFKMKEDLLFLKNSIISHFIEMDNSEIDCFLTNCAPSSTKHDNDDKIKIPIPEDMSKLITKSRYALIQECVFSNFDKDENMNTTSRRNDIYGDNSQRIISDYKLRLS